VIQAEVRLSVYEASIREVGALWVTWVFLNVPAQGATADYHVALLNPITDSTDSLL